jgi:hypothetical protein
MTTAPAFAEELIRDLRVHQELCHQALTILLNEGRTLAGPAELETAGASRERKNLLPAIETSLINLRRWRQLWQETSPEEKAGVPDLNQIFQTTQGFMMRILLVDRENQQAMLRRGLMPAQHLPVIASQQSHFVTGLYRRHCAS